jgi:competence protein ComEC
MDFGIEWMIVVTQWVAALPGAIGHMAAFGTGPLVAATAGIILLGLLRTPLRWSGAAIIGLAIAWSLAVKQPDILVSADGRNVGVRGGDGRLRLIRTGKDAFTVKEWLAADADGRGSADPTLAEGVSCDDAGCSGGLPCAGHQSGPAAAGRRPGAAANPRRRKTPLCRRCDQARACQPALVTRRRR